MHIKISPTSSICGQQAARQGAQILRQKIASQGFANIILATGASQFDMLASLVQAELDWSVCTCFHLDEYIGFDASHPASFRKYLKERFVDLVSPKTFHFVLGELDPIEECKRLNQLIASTKIDVAFIGIGENGHLAFNDPPANFETKEPYIQVELDEACRKQQWGEGWFPTLEDVPKHAISMSIHQIMQAQNIICTVPDLRKAKAVQAAVEGTVSNMLPASILQEHSNAYLFLDKGSASLLKD